MTKKGDRKSPKLKGEKIQRKCLGSECNRKFKTDNKFQRLCSSCRTLHVYRFYGKL